jgi:alpha-methylacyl-CoA racemase
MADGVTHLMSAFQAFRRQGLSTDAIVDRGAPFDRCYKTQS